MMISATLITRDINWYELNMQEHWNALELVILENVDTCALLVDLKINRTNNMSKIPSLIKNKLRFEGNLTMLGLNKTASKYISAE